MKAKIKIIILLGLILITAGCGRKAAENELAGFVDSHLQKVKPIIKELNLAYWRAANSGKDEDYAKASELELTIRKIYSDANDFAFLERIKKSKRIKDALLLRQLDELYNSYLENQIEPELMKKIVELGTQIEKNFSVFRGKIAGKEVTDNEIREILKTETDSVKRKAAWEASKQVGSEVAGDIIELVKLRNEAARKVGFENYHTMRLSLGEQDVRELDKIFNELYELTNEPFLKLKMELDEVLAEKYGADVMNVMPWHYHDPFFQESPLVYELDLDGYYKDKDVKELSIKFFSGIGLPVESILDDSDLYEREGKNPHAFCTDIDKEGDVRILCNIRNNEQWMETMLHELGHAVYDKYMDPDIPYILREPAHSFTTEAIAMLLGRQSRDASWMHDILGLTEEQRKEIEEVSGKYSQLKQLIFARWAMVMYNFEKELYANPEQDLHKLWWDTVENYQFINRPTDRDHPDWAAKIHFAIAPCYYHNYALGELLASQLHNKIVTEILKDPKGSYVGNKEVGNYLRENVFEAGSIYSWNEMIRRATGEKLTAKYFAAQFVK